MILRLCFTNFTALLMFMNAKAYWQPIRRALIPTSARRAQFVIKQPYRRLCREVNDAHEIPLRIDHGKSIKDSFIVATKWLQDSGLDDAEESARHLISHATSIGTRFSDFQNNSKKLMTNEEVDTFVKMCLQRANREPVQYIIGNWDFYGLTFECKPPILIPRPETEELVENILQTNLLQKMKAPRILDVGAGTGAIGIALLSQLSGATCCSVDINADAVQLALRNAKSLLKGDADKKYSSYHCDLRSFVKEFLRRRNEYTGSIPEMPLFDLIVSNPPYIPSADLANLQPEIRQFEDAVALDGGVDGLDIVRDLIYLAPILLSPTGTRELWLEVSEAHPAMVEAWLQSSFAEDKKAFYDKWVSEGNPEIPNWDDYMPTFLSGIIDLVGNPRFIRLKY